MKRNIDDCFRSILLQDKEIWYAKVSESCLLNGQNVPFKYRVITRYYERSVYFAEGEWHYKIIRHSDQKDEYLWDDHKWFSYGSYSDQISFNLEQIKWLWAINIAQVHQVETFDVVWEKVCYPNQSGIYYDFTPKVQSIIFDQLMFHGDFDVPVYAIERIEYMPSIYGNYTQRFPVLATGNPSKKELKYLYKRYQEVSPNETSWVRLTKFSPSGGQVCLCAKHLTRL